MNKKIKKDNLIHGKIGNAMDDILNAETRRVTGTSTTDIKQSFKPAGIEFRMKPQTEFDEHFRIPNIIKRRKKK